MLPAFTLWWREIVRFYRQRSRVVGVIASPLLFWLVIGSGFGTSFRAGSAPGQQHYLDYFYPGALIMIVLFTSIFAMMSLIEDRKEGFLLSVMVAPVPRSAIVLGKVLGGTTLAAIQGLIFLAFAPFVGVHLGLIDFLLVVFVVFLVSFALTSLGFAIAWPMDSTQAFHAIINLFLIPLWLLSGALFPLSGASGWLRLVMRLNPLTYGVEALRVLLYPESPTVLAAAGLDRRAGPVYDFHVWAMLFPSKPPHHEARRMMQVPPHTRLSLQINATLNGTNAVLLLVGRNLHQARADGRAPRRHDRRRGDFFTFSGLLSLLSLLPLLLCALAVEAFQGQGWSRPVYFTILTSHTILAIIILPMVIITLSRGLARTLRPSPRHRALDIILCGCTSRSPV